MKYQWGYITHHPATLLLYLTGTMILILLVHYSSYLITPSAMWYPFAVRPVASAIFILGSSLAFISNLAVSIDLPRDWGTMLYIPLIIAVIFMVDSICKSSWQTKLLKQLLAFFTLTILITLVELPQLLSYLVVFYLSVVLVSYYLLLFIKRAMNPKEPTITWAFILWALFPVSVIVAGIAGFDQIAVTIFGRVLSLIAATITIWILARMVSALLELFLANLPIKIINTNARTIVEEVRPVIILVHAMLWLSTILSILWIYPTLNESFESLTSFSLSIFSLTITPGSVLSIILIIYVSLLVSRGINAFLRQEVLPHYRVEPGAQISITRLVHYAMHL